MAFLRELLLPDLQISGHYHCIPIQTYVVGTQNIYLSFFASHNSGFRRRIRRIYGQVHNIWVFITSASSEDSGESAHLYRHARAFVFYIHKVRK